MPDGGAKEMSDVRARALIMVVSRPEAVEVAVEKIGPETIGLISSQNIHAKIVVKAAELEDRTRFLHGMVDSPMEIRHAFERFEYLLSELEKLGYSQDGLLLDATGGTTPMRLGAALAAMTHGIGMVHQQVDQRYVDGRWERDESKEITVVPMDNPLESTGLLREGQAVELFNRRDYGAAALVFEDVARKVTGVERGHYYNGLLLLAEAVEKWHQWRLQDRHAISAKQVDWQRLDKSAREQFREATGMERLPETLDLVRARTLDEILGNEAHEDDNVLRDLLQKRNSSILAHGLEPIGKSSAIRFLEYVDTMVDEFETRTAAGHVRLREL